MTLLADLLKCHVGSLPFTHLGLKVGANMNLARNWDPVIQIFKKRLALWMAKSLSMGGRVTLLKSVLNSLPTYYFSLYRAPKQVINRLEQLRRRFLWGDDENNRKINWVAWCKVCSPKSEGGLGIGDLQTSNYAMLGKWWCKERR